MSGATWLPSIGVAGGPRADHGRRYTGSGANGTRAAVAGGRALLRYTGRAGAVGWWYTGSGANGATWAGGWSRWFMGLVCGMGSGAGRSGVVHGRRCAFWAKRTGLRSGLKILCDSRAVGWRENGRAGSSWRRGKVGCHRCWSFSGTSRPNRVRSGLNICPLSGRLSGLPLRQYY